MAYWHGFAGLHMHTDDTTQILDTLTTLLGHRLRDFKAITCAAYITRELKREAEQRQRREERSKLTQLSASKAAPASGDSRRLKTFNLDTFKLHALGDYVSSIRTRGSTDSYSTRLVRFIRACMSSMTLTNAYPRAKVSTSCPSLDITEQAARMCHTLSQKSNGDREPSKQYGTHCPLRS